MHFVLLLSLLMAQTALADAFKVDSPNRVARVDGWSSELILVRNIDCTGLTNTYSIEMRVNMGKLSDMLAQDYGINEIVLPILKHEVNESNTEYAGLRQQQCQQQQIGQQQQPQQGQQQGSYTRNNMTGTNLFYGSNMYQLSDVTKSASLGLLDLDDQIQGPAVYIDGEHAWTMYKKITHKGPLIRISESATVRLATDRDVTCVKKSSTGSNGSEEFVACFLRL